MTYGHFDDENREYIITRPDTPSPWINYLGCEDFFGLISNTGGGYCFYRDAKLRRLLRYRYNNIPQDSNGRYFYLRDDDTDQFWSATWQPVRATPEHYECRHGLGYTRISTRHHGISSEVLYTVPLGEQAEVHHLSLRNDSDRPRRLTLTSFLEFCLWDAGEDDRNFQRNLNIGEVEVTGDTIYHKSEYRERRNHFAYYHCSKKPDAYETDRESFLGPYGSLENPRAVREGSCQNSLASGWSPIASFQHQIELQPGESRELVYLLGYVENEPSDKWKSPGIINKTAALQQIERLADPEKVKENLKSLSNHWDQLLRPFQIQSTEHKLDRMVNIWNPYQCMVTFNLSRSASYFESGVGRGMGFRDSNQDLLGFVHQAPERSRQRLLDIAATQLRDGGAYHQYQPLTKRGNADIGGNFNDDPLWLILGTCAYIRETGDFSILEESVPFENEESLAAPLLEHLQRSWTFTTNNLGPHGLPLIGRADWNDCLNLNCFSEAPGESFQTTANREGKTAESLMIAGLYLYVGQDLAKLHEALQQPDEAAKVRKACHSMHQAVETHGKDPDWFIRAYDFFGDPIGSVHSKQNGDGQIFIESQGWCIMGGVGLEDGFAKKALHSVNQHLATPHGLVILDPCYQDYHLNLGEVSSYPPGYKENGGIFCHNNPWIIIAETLVGNSERAYDYYTRIAPAWREEQSELHKVEPYVYAQMIAGKEALNHGQAKNSWLTGTAAWNYTVATQHLLGIRPGYEGLLVDPCLPKHLGEIKITRHFRDCTYHISLRPAKSASEKSIHCDGQAHPYGTEILPIKGGTRTVELSWYSE